MHTPPVKKFKVTSKVADLDTLKPPKNNSLRSSLPACLRDNSYFEPTDQWRTLLGEKKGGTYENSIEGKLKGDEDPSFGDCDVNVETDYDFD
jgi:hypothetical protein